MPIVAGFRYVQPDDPGAVGEGFEWINTDTGDWSMRNASDTAWVLIGNTNLQNVGLVPITGTTMTGPLTGATGMAGINQPDFHNGAKRDGYELARMADLAAFRAEILATIQGRVNGVLAQATGGAGSAKYKVLFKSAITETLSLSTLVGNGFNLGAVISGMTYSDGTTVAVDQLQGYGVAFAGYALGSASGDHYANIEETSPGSKIFKIVNHDTSIGAAGNEYFRLSWWAFWAK